MRPAIRAPFTFKSTNQPTNATITSMRSYLDFEKPVAELEAKVEELRAMGETDNAVSVTDEISRLEVKAALALKEVYATLTPWQKTQVARHPQRPHCLDYVKGLLTEFVPRKSVV